jgi:predicted ester cyclase
MDATEIIRTTYDYWNKKDKDSFLTDHTESSQITAPGGLVLRGLAGAEMFWEGWQSAFPDNHLTIRAIFGAGDQVAVEATFEGTHTGTLHAPDGSQIPPTGEHVSAPYVEIFTVRNDKIATDHLYFDQVDLLTQLNLMPAPGT